MFNEHYYSNSSLRSLSNTVLMFIVGHFRFDGNNVEVFPYIMGEFEEKIDIYRTNWSETLRIYLDAIDAFRGMSNETISNDDMDALAAIPEKQVKDIFAKLIGEQLVVKDWAGENSDLSTNRLVVNGRPMAAAFILKGPSLKGETHPKNMGKRGDQLVRVFDEPWNWWSSNTATKSQIPSYVRQRHWLTTPVGHDAIALLTAQTLLAFSRRIVASTGPETERLPC